MIEASNPIITLVLDVALTLIINMYTRNMIFAISLISFKLF